MVLNKAGGERSGSVGIITKASSVWSISLWQLLPTWIPGKSGSLWIASARGSSASAKSKGLKGQPCLVPLWGSKACEIMLFVVTEALGLVYKSLTQLINILPKPKASRVENKYCHSTLSNAFSASKERTAAGEGAFWEVHMMSIKRLILSAELRVWIKPNLSGWIRLVITLSNLTARILLSQPTKQIGL